MDVIEFLESWHKSPKRGNFVTVGHETVKDLLHHAKRGKLMQWVSVKKDLPKVGQEVDILVRKGLCYERVINTIYTENKLFVGDHLNCDYDFSYEYDLDGAVTHWMPLPPSPEEAENINRVSYKSLAYGFMDLSYIKQCEIISKLSLGREDDKGLEHIQIVDKFIKRAEEQKCIDKFWKEVQRRLTDEY